MQNDYNNRGRQRSVPQNNYRPAEKNAPTSSADRNRSRVQRHANAPSVQQAVRQRTDRPQSQQNRPVRESAQPTAAPNVKRNFRLAAILLILIVICAVVFGVQSCKSSSRENLGSSNKDSVKLNTPQAVDTPLTAAPVLAQYTDQSATLQIDSSYGVLIDIDKNEVIASKNADEKMYPASMTKVMTLIVAMENISNFDDTFTFTSEIIDPLYRQNASRAGFDPNETVPLKDIIYGCILPSGADCTSALAIYVAGSEEEFAKMMNEKAESLGLENTHFVTASGLHDDNHYSTCREMAVILGYAIKNDEMRKVLSTYKYTTTPTEQHPNGITVTSTLFSRMSGDEAEGVFVQGGKTGYTLEGKNCLATFAANCTESTAAEARPQYILVTAFAAGEYTPVHDAINTYKKYCADN